MLRYYPNISGRCRVSFTLLMISATILKPNIALSTKIAEGGALTINLDRSALAAAYSFDATDAPAYYLEEFFNAEAAANRTRNQILEDHIVPGTAEIDATGLQFLINGSTVQNATGRSNKPTTFSFDPADFSGTASGAIGLSGATRSRIDTGSENNRIVSGDYTLEYDVNNINAVSGRSGWTIYNHLFFLSESYNLFDVEMSIKNDNFILSGQLGIGEGAAHLNGIKDAIVGNFTLHATLATEPNSYGFYTSIQVNVDSEGQNIAGDAANEPTIAINPLNKKNIVINWRQFDSIESSSVQGGWGYSFNGGKQWNFPGILPALMGQFRSDPVLGVNSQGHFFYQSLAHGVEKGTSLFKSIDGGQTWQDPVYMFDGDKNWLTVDQTGQDSDGFIYSIWRSGTSGYNFIRSIDGGNTFDPPLQIPVEFGFGTLAVGPVGEVAAVGRNGENQFIEFPLPSRNTFNPYYFALSTNANDATEIPSFTVQELDMGGLPVLFLGGSNPNTFGSNGDVQIAFDHSNGSLRGNVYVLANLDPLGEDNLDIHFIRSDDGAASWSEPIRVNDDPSSAENWQWFAMMDVAPNSRIDALWYDTRNSQGDLSLSQLFYSYSWDGGVTWSTNQPVTPQFNTRIGFPANSKKLGDYTDVVSGKFAAHVAYTATYNNEQDVYYLKVFPDCNNNGQSDVMDIEQNLFDDSNTNHIPDVCESLLIRGDFDEDGDVDRQDLMELLRVKNSSVERDENFKMDLDSNGLINVLDARKLVLMCSRPKCAEN